MSWRAPGSGLATPALDDTINVQLLKYELGGKSGIQNFSKID